MGTALAPRAIVVLPAMLDGSELAPLSQELLALVQATTAPVLVLDASRVERISSAGLGVLVTAASAASRRGLTLQVLQASALFRDSIALTGLGRHLLISPDGLFDERTHERSL